ncbi:Betaine aldehyde dehydrogenase 2, mitochondrial [Glycine soja]|uniref:aminobutyraldehyde dehydrogenase n=1 Tax=Glycine soja TaxID=3848 RepID=A0A0B2SRS2_GLYSO|nr:Betaine aldehyde dehydrogenase 2, mitochondrial [Glycine soja]
MCFSLSQITEKKDEPGKLEVIDYGEPLDEAPADLDDVIDCFNYYAKLAEGLDAKQNAPVFVVEGLDAKQNAPVYVHKEPIGVVALITPWYLLFLHFNCLCISI